MDIEGGVAIVTGSSSGIGAACVRMLAAKGCNVVVNYARREAPARAVAAECEALGVDVLVCRADVSVDADCRRMAAAAVEKWGRIDALINNAGTTKFCAQADLEGLSAQDFMDVYAVNLIGPFQMTRAVVPQMKKQGRGAIVNISSTAALQGSGSSMAYAASKGALNTMTLGHARVLGPEIRVNAVCPGFVQGEWLQEGMGAELYARTRDALAAKAPLKTVGTPETMAQVAVALIDSADLMTGEILRIDAGNHLTNALLARG